MKSSVEKAIQLVAVGKKGSRSLTQELVQELLNEFKQQEPNPIQKAALLTAFYFKGIHENEKPLWRNLLGDHAPGLSALVECLVPKVHHSIHTILIKLLSGDALNFDESKKLGNFYFDTHKFDKEEDEIARAISAVWLRLRYASHEEYSGLYHSFMDTIKPSFSKRRQVDPRLIQISEPFDGVEKSPLITPLIASFFINEGFNVVSLCGDSSGPKYGVTLKDLAKSLNAPFLHSNDDDLCASSLGAYIDHQELTDSWVHWRKLRQVLIKRPFMATLEKFTNVMGAGISITSAFHEPFLEKMLHLGESAGFPVNIVVRKGREGSLTFSLSKPVVICCSVRKNSNHFLRHSFEYSMSDLNQEFLPDGREPIDLSQNRKLIQNYLSMSNDPNNSPKDEAFFWRVKLTTNGLKKALDWAKSRY